MTLHTEEEWIELFKLKKGFCAQIVESQEITAVCNKLESMQDEIDELVGMLESIKVKINRPHDKAIWQAVFSHSEVIVLDALISKHK